MSPPFTVTGPAKEVTALKVIVPVFVALATVNALFPVAVILSLIVTLNVVVLPTILRLPLVKAFAITEALMFAVPVTVRVLLEILQLVPEDGPLSPVDEMVNV